jgi:hypothetical protein
MLKYIKRNKEGAVAVGIAENEKLFLDLKVFAVNDEAYIQVLIEEGYIDGERENTEKAEAFIQRFVAERKDKIVEAVRKQGSYFKDKGNVLYQAGLKSPTALELAMEDIVHERVMKRKRNGDFIVRIC